MGDERLSLLGAVKDLYQRHVHQEDSLFFASFAPAAKRAGSALAVATNLTTLQRTVLSSCEEARAHLALKEASHEIWMQLLSEEAGESVPSAIGMHAVARGFFLSSSHVVSSSLHYAQLSTQPPLISL